MALCSCRAACSSAPQHEEVIPHPEGGKAASRRVRHERAMPSPTMHAMLLDAAGQPLRPAELPLPEPGPQQLRLRVPACGVCRTDLHIVDGELTEPKLPLVLGHEIVGRVEAAWRGGGRLPPRRPRRRAVARLHRRHLRLLPRRPRESLRPCPLHRLPDRWRLCLAHAGRCALLLSPAGRLQRRRSGAAPLRRADRLSLAENDGRCEAPRHLWLRRRGPYRGAGGALSGTPNLCLHAPR